MQTIGQITDTADLAGEFTEGSPAGGIPATLLKADWLNGIQRELLNVLSAVNISPQEGEDGQLLEAIQGLFRGASMNATEKLRGVLRMATQAETKAGVLSDVAVSPARLKSGVTVVTVNSITKAISFPDWLDGIIIQIGVSSTSDADGIAHAIYPMSFKTNTHLCIPCDGTAASDSPLSNIATVGFITGESSRAGAVLRGVRYTGAAAANEGFLYIAIGW